MRTSGYEGLNQLPRADHDSDCVSLTCVTEEGDTGPAHLGGEMALKGSMHVSGRGFAVALLLTCAAISLMALKKTSNSTAAMQLETGECPPYDGTTHTPCSSLVGPQ